mgnify:CR=1 FL=1
MKTNSTNPKEDLQAIRDIMERSSRFLSLSGLSGISAGIFALTGAALARFYIFDSGQIHLSDLLQNQENSSYFSPGILLALIALLVLISASISAIFFSVRKAKKTGQSIFTVSSRHLLVHLMIPMITGGVFIAILLTRNKPELIPSIMLIFYGLSLVNAGKFTFGEIHYLGLTEIALGILAGFFISQSLLLWTIGFGLVHIIYGTSIYFRYER